MNSEAVMTLPHCNELLLDLNEGVLNLTLNRPHKRNAMNNAMVCELMAVFESIEANRAIRAVVMRGAQGNFCAGGDISDMSKDSQEGSESSPELSPSKLSPSNQSPSNQSPSNQSSATLRDATWHFNRSFGKLIAKVNRAPQLVICILEGAVLGGGFGLACVSDLAIAKPSAMFAMPETGLGIIPAQIAPFVIARIGLTQARRLTLLGERLDGHTALELGIIHHVADDTEAVLARNLKIFKKCAPNATAVTKQLLLDAAERPDMEPLLDRASDDFSKAMLSDEGQEGTTAFIQKRKPSWCN
ncbi:MAG: isohexenylglutaconyl-CoA hydratase [Arenicella sp.]|jgi:isohexenylglutaconyl-CoA hydratase